MNGNVRRGFKQTKAGVIPEDWEVVRLEDVSIRITNKNRQNKISRVFSNSAINGIVLQNEYFDKNIANKNNLLGYYLVENGDFVYNPRISKYAPAGPINRNKYVFCGVVSPLYTVFRIKENILALFLEYYFSSNLWLRYMRSIANYGARHDRMNITNSDFMKMPIPYPPPKEQEKIAKILTTWDRAIEKLEELIIQKEQLKKGLMQIWIQSNKWKSIKLNEILIESKNKSSNNEEVYSVSVSKGLVNQIEHLGRSYSAKDTSNYNLVFPNDIVYTKSPTGSFPFGIIKENKTNKKVIVSPLYGVFTPKNKYISCILDAYFNSSIRTNNYLRPLIQKGAKNTINISNKIFLSGSIKFPSLEKEQQKIAQVLTTADKEIELLKEELKALKEQKRGLMQKLLIGEVRVKI